MTDHDHHDPIPPEHMVELRYAAQRMARKGAMPRHDCLVQLIVEYHARANPFDPSKGTLRAWVAHQLYSHARMTLQRERGPVSISRRAAAEGAPLHRVSVSGGFDRGDGTERKPNHLDLRISSLLSVPPTQADRLVAADRRAQAAKALAALNDEQRRTVVEHLGLATDEPMSFVAMARMAGTTRDVERYRWERALDVMRRAVRERTCPVK